MAIETAEEGAERLAKEAAARESAKKQFAEIPKDDEDYNWYLGLRMAVEDLTTQESKSGYKHDDKKVSWTLENTGQFLDRLMSDTNFPFDEDFGSKLTWRDIAAITRPLDSKTPPRSTARPRIVDEYVSMVCAFANDRRGGKKSCACVPMAKMQEIMETVLWQSSTIRNALKGAMATGDTFRNLDYFFIPTFEKSRCHLYLCGAAPKQQFAFIMDSIKTPFNIRQHPAKALLAIIISQLPKMKPANDNKYPGINEWRIYTQWARRSKDTKDDSPDAVQQRDNYNCGVFTATNCMCLAFGYSLMCYEEGDLDQFKKPRMNLDVLEVRQEVGRDEEFYGRDGEEDDWTVLDEPLLQIDGGIASTDDEDSDLEKPLDPTETRAPLYTPEQLKTIICSPGPARKDKRLVPPQLQGENLQQHGFLYHPPGFFKIEEDREYTKRELLRVCRDFGLKGKKAWSEGPLDMFERWVFSECGAFMARLRGDAVQPLDGMGETTLDIEAIRREEASMET